MKRKHSAQHTHNPKRRRPNAPTIDEVLTQGKTRLFRALKAARGFERQKLGRRAKLAHQQKDDGEISRIDAEVAALKELSLEELARDYLHKSLTKHKALREHPDLSDFVSQQPQAAPSDPARSNVRARLLNAKTVKADLEVVLQQSCQTLGVDLPEPAHRAKKAARQENGDAPTTGRDVDDSKSPREDHEDPVDEPKPLVALATQDEQSDHEDTIVPRIQPGLAEDESDSQASLDSMTQRQFKHRIAEASDQSESHSQYSSRLGSPSLSISRSPSPIRGVASARTTFLPSLATGYISGSESDVSAENLSLAPKRNRMGQRQRQAIAERKYGTKAKHVQKQGLDRDAGWDRKRGAQDVGSGGGRGRGRGRGGSRGLGRGATDERRGGMAGRAAPASQHDSREQKTKSTRTKRDDDGPLHPSWEAKKRLKEQGSKPVEFQGKKVVFD